MWRNIMLWIQWKQTDCGNSDNINWSSSGKSNVKWTLNFCKKIIICTQNTLSLCVWQQNTTHNPIQPNPTSPSLFYFVVFNVTPFHRLVSWVVFPVDLKSSIFYLAINCWRWKEGRLISAQVVMWGFSASTE